MRHRMFAGASLAACATYDATAFERGAPEFGRKDAGGAPDDGQPVDLKALAKQFTDATDKVKNLAEDLKTKYETGRSVTDEAKQKADQALNDVNGLKAQIDDIVQKLARRGEPETPAEPKSWGQTVAESAELKEYQDRRGKQGRVTIGVKAITSDAGSAGGLVVEDRRGGVIELPRRRLTIRGLLAQGRTSSNAITFVQETGFTNNADVVTEGSLKPESSIELEEVTTNVRTIAHWMKASKQILADAPALQSFIDARLRYGLQLKEEAQLLTGDGTGQNLEGLITAASAYSAPFAMTGMTMIDQIRLALLQAALAEYPADGIVLNPIDWARIETTKDETGRYIIGQPQGSTERTLWGAPVVATQAMTVDKFLAGAFGMGAQIFDREDAAVMLSDEDGDNFVKNMVTILAEERVALAIYRPEAFIYGDFGNV